MLDVRSRIVQVRRRHDEVRSPGEKWSGVRRIVVVRNDRLGDLVLTLPALRALRMCYPSAWIALIVRPSLAPLASLMDDVDQVLTDPGNTADLVNMLITYRADLALCIARDARSSWAAWKAGIPRRVGTGFRFYSPLFHRRVEEHRRAGVRHEAEYAMSFVHRSGAVDYGRLEPRLTVPNHTMESIRRWLELQKVSPPFVVLHPGSGGSCPPWPATHFVALATLLEAEGIPVVFSMGLEEDALSRLLDDEHRTIRRRPRFTGDILALSALLSCASAVVGSSTGPVHLAAALGTPTLAMHAPWPTCGVDRWGPYSENGWAIVAEHDAAMHWSRRKRRLMSERLMGGISSTVVLRCVMSLVRNEAPVIEEQED